MRAQPSSSRFISTIPAGPTTPTPTPRPDLPRPRSAAAPKPPVSNPYDPAHHQYIGQIPTHCSITRTWKARIVSLMPSFWCKTNYVDFLPNLPVESFFGLLTTYKSCFRCFAFRIIVWTQFLLSTQPEARLHCGNTPESFTCFLAEFVFRPRTTPPQTDLRVNLYFLPRRVLSPKHLFLNTIKPLLVLSLPPQERTQI